MSESQSISKVMVTGATGFVGRNIVRELLSRGLKPVCIVRNPEKLYKQHPHASTDRFTTVVGSLSDSNALQQAAQQSQAIIHLVGIIIERRLKGQTFHKIHVEGTRKILEAAKQAGVRRYAHMSALGSRPNGVAKYHQTKWAAEELVRKSGLAWTIFRPSLIHGPEGEFMQLIKKFVCGLNPPVIPYFGTGKARLQPVSVKDVAYCFVESLFREQTIGQAYELGGPRRYSWVELYNACRALMPCARRWKPIVSQPVPVAKAIAALSAPVLSLGELVVPSLGLFRFDAGQVQMSQEDNICDQTVAENTFGIQMRDFETELSSYADQIR